MAFDGELLTPHEYLPPIRIEVAPNRFSDAAVLDGAVKVQDRLALLQGYASVGAGAGFVGAMTAAALHPVLVPLITSAAVVGAALLARAGWKELHWGSAALVIVMHMTASAATVGMFLTDVGAQLLPLAGGFASVVVFLALGFARWFATALNLALQALLLSVPFGAALVASFFHRLAL